MLPTRQVCDLALKFGEAGEEGAMSRPFGVALLVAGWDSHGPALYHTDPSGTHTRFDAKAIGAGTAAAGQRAALVAPLRTARASWAGLARLLAALRTRGEPPRRSPPGGAPQCGREG